METVASTLSAGTTTSEQGLVSLPLLREKEPED